MAIFYSLHLKLANPQGGDGTKKVYASTQSLGTIDLLELAKHIAEHNSKYHRADVYGVLLQLVDCIYEQLLLGYRVELGELGTLYCNISCEGANTVAEFTVDNIKKLKVNWSRGKMFETIIKDATFERVARRKGQQSVISAEDEEFTAELEGLSTGGGSSDSSTGGNSTDSGDTGDSEGDGVG